MSTKQVPPTISQTAFNCPHCGAYTTQYWSKLYSQSYRENQRTPYIPPEDFVDIIRNDQTMKKEEKADLIKWAKRVWVGKPFMDESTDNPYNPPRIENCNISSCYNCKEISVWVHDQMVYPESRLNIEPNSDLPEHVKQLFDEARTIVSSSPKGSAALLRLCIQHLCIELGGKGKNLDADIASLVAKGLNPLVQKALDVVRVIGNESVHPGEINLNDNREVAIRLFGLVNLIGDQMITHPKSVEALYASLPESKKEGIEKRNDLAKAKPPEDA